MRFLILCLIAMIFNSGCAKLLTLVDETLKKPEMKQQLSPTQNNQTQPSQPVQQQPNNTYNNTTNNYYNQPPQVSPPQVIFIEVPKQYRTPVVFVRRDYDAQFIGINETVSWTDTGAVSYTLYRTYSHPEWVTGWHKVFTLKGTSILFEDGGRSGLHYYKVVANYEDGVQRTSVPVQ